MFLCSLFRVPFTRVPNESCIISGDDDGKEKEENDDDSAAFSEKQ